MQRAMGNRAKGQIACLEGTMNAERYIKVLKQHMLPSRQRLFREGLVYFSRTMQYHILQLLQQHGFVVEESGCWIGLPAVPDLSPIDNIWRIIKRKIHQEDHELFSSWKTYIRQEWDQIPTPKLQKLITSMPRRLQTVLKRRGDATSW